ncbi:unnamed protein product [Soboliphyme baturini]|uniref:Uncharacterized protein n=1 Tax=Soboliphyme baturini TaxID=241478 RepID=A0A183IVR2_9BILA|nr:unnamed protein product [Soboliphyme baturini]
MISIFIEHMLMQYFQHNAVEARSQFLLTGCENVSEGLHILANDPSLGLYRLQEHVRKTTPALIERKTDQTKPQLALHDWKFNRVKMPIKKVSNARTQKETVTANDRLKQFGNMWN